jgi:hypothetical protein
MDNTNNRCILCNKRVLAHARKVKCSTCLSLWHSKCLPNYSTSDLDYATNQDNNWSCPQCLLNIFPFNSIEDNDSFIHAVSNPINLTIDIESLESMVYDPFNSNDDIGEGILNDIDPDLNFMGNIRGHALQNSKYYFSSTHMESLADASHKPKTTFLHLNIRSIPKNLDNFIATMHTSKMDLDIIVFSETWLKPSNANCYGIIGFDHEFSTREHKTGGGVSIFINEKWNYKTRPDLNYSSDDLEMIWLEIDKDSSMTKTNLIVGTIYTQLDTQIIFGCRSPKQN